MDPDSTFLVTSEHSSRRFYLPCIATWFASMILGTSVGYTSPAIASMTSRNTGFPVTQSTQSLLGGLMPLGAVLGAIISAITVETFGRKGTLMLCSIPCVLGWLMIAYADNIYTLLIGRFLTGISPGFVTLAGPLYIAETSSPKTRGFFGSGIVLSSGIGIFLNYFIGIYLPWNWLAISNIFYPIIMLVLLVFSPESPLFLMKRKLHIEAKYALNFLFGIKSELSNPNLYIEEDKEEEHVSISDLGKKEILLPFCLCLALMFFQQFSAVNAVISYSSLIFGKLKSINANYASVAVMLVSITCTFIATMLTDKLGRRVFLLASGIILCLSMAAMALFYLLVSLNGSNFEQKYGLIVVIALCTFMAGFAIGFGPIPFVLMSEYVPLNARGLVSGVVIAFNWIMCFVITYIFNYMFVLIGEAGTYLFFAIFCAMSVVFVYFKIYETKGKSLLEIQLLFKSA